MAVYKGRHVTVVRDVIPPGVPTDQVVIRHMDGSEEAVTRSKVKYSKDEKAVRDKLVAEPTYIEPVTPLEDGRPIPNTEAVVRPPVPGEKDYKPTPQEETARKAREEAMNPKKRELAPNTAPKQPDRPVTGLFQAKKPM
jgi:hypothetical protein